MLCKLKNQGQFANPRLVAVWLHSGAGLDTGHALQVSTLNPVQ